MLLIIRKNSHMYNPSKSDFHVSSIDLSNFENSQTVIRTERLGTSSLTGTALQNLPHFLKYPISSHFRTICSVKDADVIKGALKGTIFDFSTHSGRSSSIINERTSLLILVAVNVASYLKDNGLPFIVFAGIHSSTFFAVSSARFRMSVDLYIDRFIPELADALSTETKDPKITVDLLVQAIILPFFQKRRSAVCLPRGKLMVDFTSAHRRFFTQQTATFEQRNSRPGKGTSEELTGPSYVKTLSPKPVRRLNRISKR
ncbi:hypothetical protein CSKR_101946 [Clonorchis sinensis]|uniref:Uncharacterized protein n=1 Tax=Clonorchis sinensis TaxID=79923 RepID=A0A3R7JYD9_CLOSI|nr:hypothetical protein CSKR_101946 [Clonorchis sinensis]